ncbi:MAG: hypothetical protein MUF75_11765 [Bacteroidia bacterium]|nr:hypothetical protein [Bacteroidia bacterium]
MFIFTFCTFEVYATLKHSTEISEDTEVVVFTSPSNVEAYFEKNKWKATQQSVAMGDATSKARLWKN